MDPNFNKKLYALDAQIAIAVREGQTEAERHAMRTSLKAFNKAIGSYRCIVETCICDLCRWAAARGRNTVTIFRDINDAKNNIRVCQCLTNYTYRQRGLG